MLRGQSNNNMNNPGTQEVTRANTPNGFPMKVIYDDFRKFGRNLMFGRFDDIEALNIGADFTQKIQATSLIGRQYKRTLPMIGIFHSIHLCSFPHFIISAHFPTLSSLLFSPLYHLCSFPHFIISAFFP